MSGKEKKVNNVSPSNIPDSKVLQKRKHAEEPLYRTLANSSPIGVYIVQDGKFKFVNAQFRKYTGYREDELLGMNSLNVVYPEDRAKVRENFPSGTSPLNY